MKVIMIYEKKIDIFIKLLKQKGKNAITLTHYKLVKMTKYFF